MQDEFYNGPSAYTQSSKRKQCFVNDASNYLEIGSELYDISLYFQPFFFLILFIYADMYTSNKDLSDLPLNTSLFSIKL